MSQNVPSQIDPLDLLAEEFLERRRRGERPTVNEYAERHPELAERIRETFPALELLERAAPTAGGHIPTPPAVNVAGGGVPATLGDFRILRLVGEGGMGVVYEAVQESLGRHVALKVLPPALVRKGKFLERFRREARAAGRLHHTNIVPVHGVGEHEGVHFIVLQFIRGHGLHEVLEEVRRLRSGSRPLAATPAATVAGTLVEGLFPSPRGENEGAATSAVSPTPTRPTALSEGRAPYCHSVARLGVQAANALAYAHGQGVIHRDIKPSNLLLDVQGTVWVADFGLAKSDDSDALTDTGDILGTLRYMAPERLNGVTDARSDIFSLGVTLFEMLTLRPAFEEADRARLIHHIMQSERLSPARIDRSIPRDLDTIVQKATARDPADRYASAADLADDLQRFLDDRPIRARRTTAREQFRRWARRNPLVATLSVLVAALLVVITAVSVISNAHLTAAVKQADANLELAKAEEWAAHMASLRAGRYSGLPGQRFGGLETIRKAMESRLDAVRNVRDLRNEAIACLCLPDVTVERSWVGLPGDTTAIDFDPSFTRYAVSDAHGRTELRRTGDGATLAELPNVGRLPNYGGLQFSPDGRYLVQRPDRGGPGAFQLWRVAASEPVLALALDREVSAYSFRADSEQVAVSFPDDTVNLYETRTGREVRNLPRAAGRNRGITFHPRRPNIVAARTPQGVTVEDIDANRTLMELRLADRIDWLGWHPEGEVLAVADSRMVRLIDAATGRLVLPPLTGTTTAGVWCAFNPKGDLLAGTDWTSTLRLWDVRTGRQLVEFPAAAIQTAVRFSSDGQFLPGMRGDRLDILRVAPGDEQRQIVPRGGEQASPDYLRGLVSHDGRVLAMGSSSAVFLYDLDRREEAAQLPAVWPLRFERDGTLHTYGPEGGLREWPATSTPELGRKYGPPRALGTYQGADRWDTSADGKVMSVPLFHQGAEVVRRERKDSIRLGPQPDVRFTAVSPDGRFVATGSHGPGTISVWDAETGKLVRELLPEGGIPAFSPDGRWLVASVSATRGEFRLWHVDSWEPGPRIPTQAGGVAAFSSDGRLMAVGGEPGFVLLVSPDTGEEVARLFTPDRTHLHPQCFTPGDGRLVALGTPRKAIYVWELAKVRAGLRDLGLDWDDAPLSPPVRPFPEPLRVRIQTAAVAPQSDPVAQRALASAVLALNPNSVGERIRRAVANIDLGNYPAAFADLDEAVRLRPTSTDALLHRGWLHRATGQGSRAMADFGAAIRDSPGSNVLRAWRSEIARELGDTATQREDLTELEKLESGNLFMADRLARLLLLGPKKERDPARALELARRTIDVLKRRGWDEEQMALYRNTEALALFRGKQYQEALALFRAGADRATFRQEPFELFGLALCHQALGEKDQARECFDRAMRWRDNPGSWPPDRAGELKALEEEATAALDSHAGKK